MTSRSKAAAKPASDAKVVAALRGWQDRIAFDEVRHRYSYNGEALPSVTTIIDATLAKPALLPWAARVQREADVAFLDEAALFGYSWSRAKEALLAIPANAHRSAKERAADIGTEVHALIEAWCRRKVGEVGIADPDVSDDAMFVYEGWEAWAKSASLEPLLVEVRVCNEGLGYCGKLDVIARIEGRLAIADWKSGKAIYDEYWLQLEAYREAVWEMAGAKLDTLVCRLPKTRGPIEAKWMPLDHDATFDAFGGLLDVYNWKKIRP